MVSLRRWRLPLRVNHSDPRWGRRWFTPVNSSGWMRCDIHSPWKPRREMHDISGKLRTVGRRLFARARESDRLESELAGGCEAEDVGNSSGPAGAADRLLGLKPTTLESRIKKLGFLRPTADDRQMHIAIAPAEQPNGFDQQRQPLGHG